MCFASQKCQEQLKYDLRNKLSVDKAYIYIYIYIKGELNANTARNINTGAADDLELVGWLCERIWVLQGNFTHEDGYAAARISIAEMLKSGTTCFLESMVRGVSTFFL